MTPRALIISLLFVISVCSTVPSSAFAYPDDIGSIILSGALLAEQPSHAATEWSSSSGIAVQHIAGWLISATVYGLCLTTSLPELIDGEPQLTVVRLSRGSFATTGNITNMRPWTAAIARSVGVVMVSFGDEPSRGSGPTGLRIALLPIGPARSGGLSIAGSFSFL